MEDSPTLSKTFSDEETSIGKITQFKFKRVHIANFTDSWSEIFVSGVVPTARHCTSTVVFRDRMYIFGGYRYNQHLASYNSKS